LRGNNLKNHVLKVQAVLTILLLSSIGLAQTLTGTVKNSTTGKSASGDEVVLLKLGEGIKRLTFP
jgi:hypothetical protein